MTPAPSPPVFRVETALVPVDAVVTDRQARRRGYAEQGAEFHIAP